MNGSGEVRRIRRGAAAFAVLALLCGLGAGARAQEAPDYSGAWNGKIDIPGSPLGVIVTLTKAPAGWIGTIDIPAQNVKGLTAADIKISGDSLSFGIAQIPGSPRFQGVYANGKVTGIFTQSGQSFPFLLGRDVPPEMQRPQDPKPPFPYKEEEVKIPSGGIVLAGTLTIPEGKGPFPAVALLSGSGPQDRNEELLGHKPFLVLSDYLTRSGIAVLRCDDRGIGGSGGSLSESSSEVLAQDALAEVGFLRARPEIRKNKVGLIGHSEGGLIAPIAASESKNVAFIVMMAGPGVRGDEILHRQTEKIFRLNGVTGDTLTRVLDQHRKVLDLMESGADSVTLYPAVERLVKLQFMASGRDTSQIAPEQFQVQAAAATRQMLSPWFRFFVRFDPSTALSKVKVPVLALNGDLDVQVDPDQNLPAIEAALKKAGNKDYTLTRYPGVNHLFQGGAKTGLVQEYPTISETMNPAVLEAIRDWVLRHGK